MKLLLVRHGETVDNKRRVCQGQLPGELNKKGRQQAQGLALSLAGTPLDYCYTSDLQRARQTCDIITAPYPNLPVSEDRRLRERHFGAHQGTIMTTTWNGFASIEGAEPMEDLYARLENFIADITATHAKKTVLVVSHGITLLTLTAVCLGYTLSHIDKLALPANCSVSYLERTEGLRFSLVEHKGDAVNHAQTPVG